MFEIDDSPVYSVDGFEVDAPAADFHEDCGHFHLDRSPECPEGPGCGDYRCCQP